MQSFGGKLEIGMLAMVVNTCLEANKHLIGSVVTVEGFMEIGEILPAQFCVPGRRSSFKATERMVVASGCTSHVAVVIENHACFDERHLMPLPPLDDDVIIESTEKPKETATC
jgi:hypothetical protein